MYNLYIGYVFRFLDLKNKLDARQSENVVVVYFPIL